MTKSMVSVDEISRHKTLDDLWLVVDGVVYDMSEFAEEHPGGPEILLQHAGRDASAAYSEVHSPSLIKKSLPADKTKGTLDQSTVTEAWARSPVAEQQEAAAAQKNSSSAAKGEKPPLSTLISSHDFEEAARTSLSAKAWAFSSSASTDCITKSWNANRYNDLILRPRVLVDVRRAEIETTMLGHRIAAPIFCAPTSMGKLFHPEGERELARSCRGLGIPQCVSTSCSYPFPEVMDAAEEDPDTTAKPQNPVFFQLYVDKDRRKTAELLKQVRQRGAAGIFLTVDAPVVGKREADERLRADESLKLPMTGMSAKTDSKGGGMGRIMGGFIDPSLDWSFVRWLRRQVPDLPIVIKGVQTAMDAVRAMDAGCDGIYLTNHGGRSLDTSPATILVLLELQRCCPQIFDKMEVFVDGGIQRGTDILKALCLGAKAVGIGRGFLFALHYGQEGIEHYIEILRDELETAMRMVGITSLDECHPGLVNSGAVDHLVPTGEEHPYARWRPKMRSRL